MMRQAWLCVVALWSLLRCDAFEWPQCSITQQHTICALGFGESWTPTPRNVSGTLTITGIPGSPASTLNLGMLGRNSLGPASALNLQDLTVVTDIAVPRANTPLNYLVPLNLSDSGTLSITYTNVTLRLPSSCISLAQYAAALCRSSVNSNTTINRWGVGYRTWATAVVIARNLNLTCGQPLPPSFNLMCTNVAVTEPEQLLAALVATGGMAVGTTSYIHILSNISLQAVAYEPWAGALATPRWCSDRGQLVIVTNMVVIAGACELPGTMHRTDGLVRP
ncbi:hypothetical protein HaLaN_30513, partial [Haematococcus lacustris]